MASVSVTGQDGSVTIAVDCQGARARLRPVVIDGLEGRRLGEGLAGLWVQAYYLRQIVNSVGGTLSYDVGDERVGFSATIPV